MSTSSTSISGQRAPLAVALIRHTAPDIAPGVCYGRSDVPALPFGAELPGIVAAVRAFAPTRIVSSPLRRCCVLAETLAAATAVSLHWDARLVELDFGCWEGVRWGDIARPALDAWSADVLGFVPPCGESGAALIERVTAAFADVRSVGGRVAVVAHAGPLRVLAALASGGAIDLLRPGPGFGSVAIADPVASD